MQWYLKVLRQYVDFNGRARRKEYWMFALFTVIVSIVLTILDRLLGLNAGGFGLLSGLYGLAVLLPSLGVSVRRLHDTGRSGWWLLVLLPVLAVEALVVVFGLAPPATPPPLGILGIIALVGIIGFVGAIVLTVFQATDGNRGPNNYGPDPKAAQVDPRAGGLLA